MTKLQDKIEALDAQYATATSEFDANFQMVSRLLNSQVPEFGQAKSVAKWLVTFYAAKDTIATIENMFAELNRLAKLTLPLMQRIDQSNLENKQELLNDLGGLKADIEDDLSVSEYYELLHSQEMFLHVRSLLSGDAKLMQSVHRALFNANQTEVALWINTVVHQEKENVQPTRQEGHGPVAPARSQEFAPPAKASSSAKHQKQQAAADDADTAEASQGIFEMTL